MSYMLINRHREINSVSLTANSVAIQTTHLLLGSSWRIKQSKMDKTKSMTISELRALKYKQQAGVLTNRESIWESAARLALLALCLCAHSHLLRQQNNWARSWRSLLHMTDCNDRG